ncbi:hypothetical protein HDU91_001071 [Kappamyces sp. JEL0680]|nr:hypothetical protein HDU91_001071 [Kappamyces sp. JEL0680]
MGCSSSATDSVKRQHLFNEFAAWILHDYVMPLLQSNFYITETAVHKHQLHFFRHKLWTRINAPLFKSITESLYDEFIPTADLEMESVAPAVSSMRLLPKKQGARPIVNLRKAAFVRGSKLLSVNSALKNALAALSYEVDQMPRLVGHSVSGKADIHRLLRNYKQRLLADYPQYALQRNQRGLPKLYFCTLDIRACFDSLDQTRVMDIVESTLLQPEYTISKYATVHVVLDKIRKIFRSTAKYDFAQFSNFAGTVLATEISNAVVVDQVTQSFEERQELLEMVREHIQRHVVKVGKRYFKQSVGIPQGSVLSSLLCNLYFGRFEECELKDLLSDGHSLLMRYVDDFIFISTSPSKTAEFATTVIKARSSYGFAVNAAKSLANIDILLDAIPIQKTHAAAFPWYGLLINTGDLGVSLDYSRALGTALRNSINIDATKTPGYNLYVKTMTHAIFVDPVLNSPATIQQSILDSFLMCARRFVVHVKELFSSKSSLNAEFVRTTILEAVHYQHSLIRSKLARTTAPDLVSRDEVFFLGLGAFAKVLKLSQPKFDSTTATLDQLLASHRFQHVKKRIKGVY